MLNIVNINTVRLEHQLRMAIIGYLEEDIVFVCAEYIGCHAFWYE